MTDTNDADDRWLARWFRVLLTADLTNREFIDGVESALFNHRPD